MEKIKVNAYWRPKPYTVNLSSKKSTLKFYVKRIFKMTFAFVVVSGSLWLAYNFGLPKIDASLRYQKDAGVMATEMLQGKIDNVKAGILADLSTGCETKGVKDPDGAIVFDSNNEASIGRYQFQRKTVIHYYQKFYNQTLTNAQAIAVAIDPVKSKALASKILFEEPGGYKNWYNCSNKLNIPTKVELVKAI